MLEPVERMKGFNLRPDTYSYILVSGSVRVTVPYSEPNSPAESHRVNKEGKEGGGIGFDGTSTLQDKDFFDHTEVKGESFE